MKARRESLLDQISHLKKDLELSNTERKHDEGSHSNLLEENKSMRRNLDELRDSQVINIFLLLICQAANNCLLFL